MKLHISHYTHPYSPLHADFHDSIESHCRLSETISCTTTPRLLLGLHGHLMTLTPAMVRRLIPPLVHFAANGRLPHPTASPTADYEI